MTAFTTNLVIVRIYDISYWTHICKFCLHSTLNSKRKYVNVYETIDYRMSIFTINLVMDNI